MQNKVMVAQEQGLTGWKTHPRQDVYCCMLFLEDQQCELSEGWHMANHETT